MENEIIEQNEQDLGIRDMQIGVGYDADSQLFIMRWEVAGRGFLESRMDHEQYQNLTARMQRMLQQVNLAQAIEYQRKKDCEQNKN